MGHIFLALLLSLFIFVSSASHAETTPLQDQILAQLRSSEYDYAEKAHTGMTFYYGKFTFNPDKLTRAEIEEIALLMETGRFNDGIKVHDLSGIEWIFNSGYDRPFLFKRLFFKDFIYRSRTKILSSYPNYRAETIYNYQRRNFVIIPEYLAKQEEKGMKDAEWIAGQEVDRITNSKIGSTPGVELPKRLALPAPSCNKLF